LKTKVLALSLLFFSLTSIASAQSFKVLNHNSKVYRGGVVVVKIDDSLENKNLKLYIAGFNGLPTFNKNGLAYIGVDIRQELGSRITYLVGDEDKDKQPEPHDFYKTYIEILDKKFDDPWFRGPVKERSKKDLARRAKELDLLNDTYALINATIEEDLTAGPFIQPLEIIYPTDNFGTPRIWGNRNRKSKKITVPHAGVDLRAKKPTPVMAINSGRVLLAKFLPGVRYGNTVIIDHGSGILSMYLHLSKFKVKDGDIVKNGQIIALTGGTPSHLHFQVKIHNVDVDPLAFIDTFNRSLAEVK